MDMTKGSNGVVFVVLLCVLASGSSDGRPHAVDDLPMQYGGRVLPPSSADQNMQEAQNAFKSAVMPKLGIKELVETLSPSTKKSLTECLRELNTRSLDFSSEDATFKDHFFECIEFLQSSLHIFPIRESRKQEEDLPDPPQHAPAPAPSENQVPSSPPRDFSLPPAPAGIIKAPNKPRKPLQEKPHLAPSPWSHHPAENTEEDGYESWMKIAVAVAATAVVTFLLVACIFLCCLRRQKKEVRVAQKDHSPLLKLSSSDHSASSFRKFFSLRKSSNKEFSGNNLSSVNNLSSISDNQGQVKPGVHSAENKASSEVPPPAAPPPPPPPKPRPPPPPKAKMACPPPVPPAKLPRGRKNSSTSDGDESNGDPEVPKARLKPFFWDKVATSPDHQMVWHNIKAGSFQFNEQMMESLFGYEAEKNKGDRKKDPSSTENAIQYIQIIDPKKAQNLSILLKALSVTTEEVCEALQEGSKLPMELVQTLIKMAPTPQEELKLRLYSGDLSQLGPAERFLKILVDIPFAFKRLEALQFMNIAEEEVSNIKESLVTLEVACSKIKNSRLFLKLLEAVLKTGNRMNVGTYRGGAQAFKLDTLLKLSDVRGTDGKTTLLHFVVQEIIRSEGIRAIRTARESQSTSSLKSDESALEDSNQESAENLRILGLQVVSGLSTELADVKKAAIIDADNISGSVAKLENSLVKARELLNTEMKSMEEDSKFPKALLAFVEQMEAEVTRIAEDEKRITALIESTADYFHGNAGKSEGLRLFTIVRDFLIMLDKACREVKDSAAQESKSSKAISATVTESPSRENARPSPIDMQQKLFPAIAGRRMYNSGSSDDGSDSEDK